MDYSWIDFFTLIGSVCLFLYGMSLMSEGLQKIAGDRLRSVLAMMTNNRFMGTLTGILVTALVQSSSATTVMIVSFVNAGLISLAQSMAVIMGANVGTTVTTWIIAIFGFKFNIAAFVLPLIALSFPLFNSSKSTRTSWGEFIIGFALLFLGLDSLNHSVPDLKSNPELFAVLTQFTQWGYLSVVIFLLIGMLLTMVVQASSASFTIALIMCSKGWISFDMACALVLGSNIGTCITPLIASLSANTMAKRAAMGHLMFNVLGTLWTLILYYPFCNLIMWISESLGQGNPSQLLPLVNEIEALHPNLLSKFSSQADVATLTGQDAALYEQYTSLQGAVSFGMTMFHTVFNLINLSVMIWLTNVYVTIVTKIIPDKKGNKESFKLQYLSSGLINSGELALVQVKNEANLYAEETYKMFSMLQSMLNEKLGSEKQLELYEKIRILEGESDKAEVEIADFLYKLQGKSLSVDGDSMARMLYKVVDELESVADSISHVARTLKEKSDARVYFSEEMNVNVRKMMQLVDTALMHMTTTLERNDISNSAINKAYNLEDEINNLRAQLRNSVIDKINTLEYDYQQSTFYIDIVNECEKIGDYIINVINALTEK